jgi:hypothetical protein
VGRKGQQYRHAVDLQPSSGNLQLHPMDGGVERKSVIGHAMEASLTGSAIGESFAAVPLTAALEAVVVWAPAFSRAPLRAAALSE